MRRIEERFI